MTSRQSRSVLGRLSFLPHSAGLMRKAILLAFLSLCSFPANAQEAESGNDEVIIVQGDRLGTFDEKETRRIADNYVRELTIIDNSAALALYEPGVYCPAVVGLSEGLRTQTEERMRRVAKAVGVDPADRECKTSALVLFVDDKRSFLEEFRLAHPVYFQTRTDKFWTTPREAGPAVAWQLSSLIDENGTPTGYGGTVDSFTGGSRLLSMTRTVIAMSVVIIEREALAGLNVEQVADYSLMRGLIGGDVSGLAHKNAATILTVLATPMGQASYASLTEWDFSYLKERYSGDPRIYAERKGAALRRAVRAATEDRPPALDDSGREQ